MGFSAVGLSAAFVALRYASKHKVELRWAVLRWLLGGVWKSREARDLAAEAAVFHLIEADVVKRSNYASILPISKLRRNSAAHPVVMRRRLT